MIVKIDTEGNKLSRTKGILTTRECFGKSKIKSMKIPCSIVCIVAGVCLSTSTVYGDIVGEGTCTKHLKVGVYCPSNISSCHS